MPLAPQLSHVPKRLVVHCMRLRLRDNSEVLAWAAP